MQRLTRSALAGLTLALVLTGLARAQTPPMRTFGTATVDGQPAPAGTVVEVLVGETVCGRGEVRRINDELPLGYVVDVISAATQPGCAGEGEQVSFRVGGRPAAETAPFETGSFLRLDLTVTGQVQTPTPGAATPPPFGSTTPTPAPGAATGTATTPTGTSTATPAGTATATPDATGTADASATPTVTATGTATVTATATARATVSPRATPTPGDGGDDDDGGSTAAIALIAGLVVAAAAAGGYYLFRRSRAG